MCIGLVNISDLLEKFVILELCGHSKGLPDTTKKEKEEEMDLPGSLHSWPKKVGGELLV